MKALNFEEANTNFGATQDEYNTLPGWQGSGLAIFCFEPDAVEMDLLVSGARLSIIRLNFGERVQRTGVFFRDPFAEEILEFILEEPTADLLVDGMLFDFTIGPYNAVDFIKNRKIWVVTELIGSLQPINIFV